MTIGKRLKLDIALGKLAGGYIIHTDNIAKASREIETVITNNIFESLEGDTSGQNPDLIIVNKPATAKAISIEQIRQLRQFLYKTSMITGTKVAIINDADQMNINAANCSLKMLEDTPANTHIFLVTTNIAGILPTVKSRCIKINHIYSPSLNFTVEETYLYPLLKSTSFNENLNFIKSFAGKDRDLWAKFANHSLEVLCRLTKHVLGCEVKINSLEQEILTQFDSASLGYMLDKYNKLKELIYNTENFDLDLQTGSILLIQHFKN